MTGAESSAAQPWRVKWPPRSSAAFSPSFPARASETALPPPLFRLPFRGCFSGASFSARCFLSVLPSQLFDTAFRHGLSGATLPEGWFFARSFPVFRNPCLSFLSCRKHSLKARTGKGQAPSRGESCGCGFPVAGLRD